jgi:hypothetical protein
MIVQPQVPSARPTHAGPAMVPSGQILFGTRGPMPGQRPGPHTGGRDGQVVIVQAQTPFAPARHVGPAVVPSGQIVVGAPGRGPGQVLQVFGAPPLVGPPGPVTGSLALLTGVSGPPQLAATIAIRPSSVTGLAMYLMRAP